MLTRLLVLAAILGIGNTASADLKPGDRAADFEKSTRSGATLRLSSLRGKVVLLDFWASWCEPCKRELPILDRLAPRLRSRGIEIVTVNIDDNSVNEERFLNEKGLRSLTVVNDFDKAIIGKYEPPKMPSSFVVDKGGVVRAVNAGFDEGDEHKLEQQLLALVGK